MTSAPSRFTVGAPNGEYTKEVIRYTIFGSACLLTTLAKADPSAMRWSSCLDSVSTIEQLAKNSERPKPILSKRSDAGLERVQGT